MSLDEIHESNTQFHGAWRFFARNSPAGQVLDLPEVSIASSNVAWTMMNAAFLPSPVDSPQALERAAAAASAYFQPRGRGWMFALCEDWLSPRLRERVGEVLAPQGLTLSLMATGMVTERLAPALRPMPSLEVRGTQNKQARMDLADVNSRCYALPLEQGREAFDVPSLFETDNKGFVGYRQEEAATAGAVMRLGGVAYVSMVATLPAHRRLGCAEALMRRALDEAHRDWGVERTVLHATAVGLPVYRRLGYRAVTRFHFYLAPPSTAR